MVFKLIRPDSVEVWKNQEISKRFPKYKGIIDGKQIARYLLARSLECEFNPNDSIENLSILLSQKSEEFKKILSKKSEELKGREFKPQSYIDLAERLGNFSSQLAEGRAKVVSIQYSGGITQQDVSPITMALIKGFLTTILEESVNFVNACSLAETRGIKIKETKLSSKEEFVNLISVKIETNKETRRVYATLSPNRQPRIVKIDDFYVELSPQGYLIVIKNWDKPGIIGNLGTLLGKHNINIAAMTFGRKKPGGEAISVLNVDSPISPDLLGKISSIENVLAARLIRLGG